MDHRQPEVQSARLAAANDTEETDPLLQCTARDAACTAAEWRTTQNDAYGYTLMALSTLGFSLMTLFVHVLGSPAVGFAVPSMFIVWCRSVLQTMAAAIALTGFVDLRAALSQLNVFRFNRMILRGIIGTMGFYSLFEALARLPLGDCSTSSCTLPNFLKLMQSILIDLV